MPRVRVEFTVEPFVDGRPGAHVLAAWSAVESHGAALDSGPFSSETTIDEAALEQAVTRTASGRVERYDAATDANPVTAAAVAQLDAAQARY